MSARFVTYLSSALVAVMFAVLLVVLGAPSWAVLGFALLAFWVHRRADMR